MTLPKPLITEADVYAVRAVIIGNADKVQQQRAMRVIGEQFCRIFDSPYVANGGDRDTFVMLGRHQVGVMISSMQTPEVLEKARADDLARANPPTKTRRGKSE